MHVACARTRESDSEACSVCHPSSSTRLHALPHHGLPIPRWQPTVLSRALTKCCVGRIKLSCATPSECRLWLVVCAQEDLHQLLAFVGQIQVGPAAVRCFYGAA